MRSIIHSSWRRSLLVFASIAIIIGCSLLMRTSGLAQDSSPSNQSSPNHSAAQAMSRSPQTALTQLFTSSQAQSDWFTPEFLRQVPLAQLQQLVTGIERDLGAYQDVQMAGDRFLVRFERGQIEAHISLNREGQIAGLLLQPVPNAITLDQAIEQLKTFPGQVNFLVLEESSERAALNADQPLAVGSTFKLAVLSALRQQIESEQRHWNDVVELQSAWKSLPSGILQDWPSDSWVTLQTLATLMISISDNTATDALIHVLGRDAIEAFTERNRPLLTTREFFTLKAPQYQDVLQRYRAANTAERRRILDQLAEYPLPNLTSSSGEGLFADGPTALDIEYFFTPHELCRLMSNVKDLSLMHVNPGTGLLNPSDWAQVAYKGGSEPGVLNLTHWLESPTGKTYCVVTTWNNVAAPLDETRLYNLHRAVIQGLQ